MRKSVKVSTATRDRLKQIHLGESYELTISYLAGRWTRYKPSVAVPNDRKDTVIKISEDGHRFLQRLRDDMSGVDTLGGVLAVLTRAKGTLR